MQKQHKKIEEFKRADLPINYRNLSVNKMGTLTERTSLLDKRIVEGYGAQWTVPNSYGEVFVKGAFSKSIKELGPNATSNYKIKFRDRHCKAMSLFEELKEDDIGLYFKTVPLDQIDQANDLLVQLKSGTINNFSIGFKHVWDQVEWDDENDVMINIEARLFEISAVDIPSDMETYAIRSDDDQLYLNDDIEDFISSLPRPKQLEARQIFTRCMTPAIDESLELRRKELKDKGPELLGLDFNYLISKL
jgi:HK97 family phage prohead protease